MSDITTSAPPPIMAISFSGASSARKSSCAKLTPGTSGISSRSIATTLPLSADRADPLGGDLAPAAGGGAEIDHRDAMLEKTMLVVDFDQLVGRA